MPFPGSMLSSATWRAMCQIDPTVLAVKLRHSDLFSFNYKHLSNLTILRQRHTYYYKNKYLHQTMSLKLEIQKKMLERSPRVKALDFHQDNSWVVFGLYSGTLTLHDYSTNTCIRTIEASVYPVRTVKFLIKKQAIICGSDDFMIRVFNYHTMEKIKQFQAHGDFIRCLIVHPLEPYVISGSDQAKIKIWNFQNNFSQVALLDEHKHFVMALAFNPKDLTKFASGSMDKTIKIWNLKSEGKANLTLSGHKSCVNCLDFHHGDKPHIVSGSDDRTIKIWDYQTKQCLNTIDAYSLAVSSVSYHPELPIMISTGEEGKTIIHHTGSYAVLNVLQYNLGMGWAAGTSKQNTNIIGIGYDEGSVIVRIGSDDPVVSMNNGKILWAKSMEILTSNLKAIDLQKNKSGERVDISSKQIGHTDIYPSYIKHSPNGHHFGLCNQSQFSVIKIASFKSVILGNGTSLVWANDTDFAVLENDTINIYRQFQYSASIKLPFVPKKIYEGHFLAVAGNETFLLYDWQRVEKPVHSFDYGAERVWWNDDGTLLMVATSDKLLGYKLNKKTLALAQVMSIACKASSGVFCGSTFFYMNGNAKLNFVIRGKSFLLQNYEKKKFILGLIEAQKRLYFFNRNNHVFSLEIPFQLFHDLNEFIGSGGNKSFSTDIPRQLRDVFAKAMNQFGLHKQAYKLVENQDTKFEIALQLGFTRQAFNIAKSIHSSHKIKLIGDMCLKSGDIEMSIQCFEQAQDMNSLLLIYSSLSLPDQLSALAQKAQKMTKMNIAYTCYFLTNQPNKCVDILIKSKKFSEAALFSRTYCPERVPQCVKLWRESIPDKLIANKISDLADQEQDQEGEEDEEGEEGEENEQNEVQA